jgi:hypothetical protein
MFMKIRIWIGAVLVIFSQYFTQLLAVDSKPQENASSASAQKDPLIGTWTWTDSRKIIASKPAWLGIAEGGKAHIVGKVGSWRRLPGERPKYELNMQDGPSYYLVLDSSGKSLEVISKTGSKADIKSTKIEGFSGKDPKDASDKDAAIGAWSWPGAEFLGLHSDQRANIDGQNGSWRRLPGGVPKYELNINDKDYAGGFLLTLDPNVRTMHVVRNNGSAKPFTISKSEDQKFLKFIR